MMTTSSARKRHGRIGTILLTMLFMLVVFVVLWFAWLRPKPAPVDNNIQGPAEPAAITASNQSQAIRESLRSVNEKLTAAKTTYAIKLEAEKDLVQAIGQLHTLSKTAREDCDAFIRMMEDIHWELPMCERGYRNTAELYRKRAEDQTDPALKAVELRTAEMLDNFVADIPRRQKVTAEFIETLRTTRTQLAGSARTLAGQKNAIEIDMRGGERPVVKVDTAVYMRQFEQFLAVVERYYAAFGAPPPPYLAEARQPGA